MADALRDWLSRPCVVKNCEGKEVATESPIEAMFIRSFYMRADAARAAAMEPLGIKVWPQRRLDSFRVDFLLERGARKLVVECDGHEFHERTKEQATKDKSRDRALVSRGYTVMRFTGSEIWANPFPPAQEALGYLLRETD